MKMNREQFKNFIFETLKENNELSFINNEISKLEQKDKEPEKEGIQGLTKDDLRLLKKFNLAKILARKRDKNN